MKQVIVIRRDLKMSPGKLAAQVAHASVSATVHNPGLLTGWWLEQGMAKIVAKCESEDELFQLYNKAKELDIITEIICDAGKTEFKEPTYTCVAIGPDYDELVDKITGELKLL